MTFQKGNVRQWHYDHCHTICNPALVTIPSFQCGHCLEWFPKVVLQKQHECPAKLPLGRLHKIATENVEQQGFGASLVTSTKDIFSRMDLGEMLTKAQAGLRSYSDMW